VWERIRAGVAEGGFVRSGGVHDSE
jgi:hypothetical protein